MKILHSEIASEAVFGHKYHSSDLPVCSLHVCMKLAIAHAKLIFDRNFLHYFYLSTSEFNVGTVYKECWSSSSSVQGVPKLVHRTCTDWTLAWVHAYISKQFLSLVTLSVTAWTWLVHICEQVSFQVGHSKLYSSDSNSSYYSVDISLSTNQQLYLWHFSGFEQFFYLVLETNKHTYASQLVWCQLTPTNNQIFGYKGQIVER